MRYIKKADYIAKYGEEAWNAKAEKRREYFKQYNDKRKEYLKQYKEANRDRIAEYNKQYYEGNKERIAERHKQYNEANKERIAEQNKQYCEANKERLAEQLKQYRNTQFGRANYLKNVYIQKDKQKGFSTDQNIDEDWIIENIFDSQCIYCGDSDWTHLGADRIDNSKPHTPDNCVCACRLCNIDRKDRYSVQDFIKIKQGKNLQSTI